MDYCIYRLLFCLQVAKLYFYLTPKARRGFYLQRLHGTSLHFPTSVGEQYHTAPQRRMSLIRAVAEVDGMGIRKDHVEVEKRGHAGFVPRMFKLSAKHCETATFSCISSILAVPEDQCSRWGKYFWLISLDREPFRRYLCVCS